METDDTAVYRNDCKRYGRALAGALRDMAAGTATPCTAAVIRRELDAQLCVIKQQRKFGTRVIRAGVRRTLDDLLHANARPVAGGVLAVIDGGKPHDG